MSKSTQTDYKIPKLTKKMYQLFETHMINEMAAEDIVDLFIDIKLEARSEAFEEIKKEIKKHRKAKCKVIFKIPTQ